MIHNGCNQDAMYKNERQHFSATVMGVLFYPLKQQMKLWTTQKGYYYRHQKIESYSSISTCKFHHFFHKIIKLIWRRSFYMIVGDKTFFQTKEWGQILPINKPSLQTLVNTYHKALSKVYTLITWGCICNFVTRHWNKI